MTLENIENNQHRLAHKSENINGTKWVASIALISQKK